MRPHRNSALWYSIFLIAVAAKAKPQPPQVPHSFSSLMAQPRSNSSYTTQDDSSASSNITKRNSSNAPGSNIIQRVQKGEEKQHQRATLSQLSSNIPESSSTVNSVSSGRVLEESSTPTGLSPNHSPPSSLSSSAEVQETRIHLHPNEGSLSNAAIDEREVSDTFTNERDNEHYLTHIPNCQSPTATEESNSTHLSFLDKMFRHYDKRAWPTYGKGYPTLVGVNIYINSMGSVNAANMEYSMDIYLRQSWKDPRLQLCRFGVKRGVTLNGEEISQKIWKPDLFFRNVKEANFHTVTVPNKLIKLSPDGKILFSMRLTLKLSCHMSFRHYPLDTQRCQIVLGPYAQTVEQVVIKWQDDDPIVVDQPLELPEFDVAAFSRGNFTRDIDTGAFSFLNVTFVLVRQNGYHLIQTYMPTFLIVMISWVSFWLNVDATPARVTLGVTTLLTLTTVASGVRTQLPPVSYVKAIDVWIGACSVMVFGALLEFTLVNYLSRSKLRPEELRKSINIFHWNRKIQLDHSMDDQMATGNEIAKNLKRARTVDRVCRVMFPLTFFVFNMIYWPYYLFMPD